MPPLSGAAFNRTAYGIETQYMTRTTKFARLF